MSRWTPERIEQVCRTGIPHYDPWADAEGFTFDHERALRIIAFFEEVLTFTKGRWAGQPFLLQDWQAALVGNLFGWVRRDGTRRYRKCLLFTARKSGKTELAAGIALYLLFCDGEPTPELVSAAGNADQAEKVFAAAKAMLLAEPEFTRRAEPFRRSIIHYGNGGVYKVINAAARTKHGDNLHAALVDELHAIADAELVDVLETSMRTRTQPLVLYTTTAGVDPETIAGEVYDYALKVRDGLAPDPEFLPVLYEAPKEADPASPDTWRMAQPSLGVTVPLESYQRDYAEAIAVPRKMQVFRQLSLNQWTEAAESWIGLDDWRACGGIGGIAGIAGLADIADLKGRRATLGIDLSSTTDTTAIVAHVEHDGRSIIFPFIFIPADNTEGRYLRQKRDRAPYTSWIRQGFITATPGNVVDYGAVEAKIIELAAWFDITEIQADPFNASGLLERLQAAGLPVCTVRQGWSLAEATKETERMILARELLHPDNPAFNWQVMGTVVREDHSGNYWPTKGRSTRRIDATVAMVMAINAAKFGEHLKAAANVLTTAPRIITM